MYLKPYGVVTCIDNPNRARDHRFLKEGDRIADSYGYISEYDGGTWLHTHIGEGAIVYSLEDKWFYISRCW